MNRFNLTAILILVLTSPSALGDNGTSLHQVPTEDQTTHYNNAVSLVTALGVEARYFDNQEVLQQNLEKRLAKLEVKESAPYYERVQVFKSDVSTMMVEIFDWPSDQRAIATAYANHFSDEELEQVLTFFNSPAYQSYLKSKGAFQAEFQKISQRRNEEVSKKFAKIYADFRTDLLASND